MNAPPLNTPSCFGVKKDQGGSSWPYKDEWVFLPKQPTSKLQHYKKADLTYKH